MSEYLLERDDVDSTPIVCKKRPGFSNLYSVDRPYPFPHSVIPHNALLSLDLDTIQLEMPRVGLIRCMHQVGGKTSIKILLQGIGINLEYEPLFPHSRINICRGTFRKDHAITPLLIPSVEHARQVAQYNTNFRLEGEDQLDLQTQGHHLFRHGEHSPYENGSLNLSFIVKNATHNPTKYRLRFPHLTNTTLLEGLTTEEYWYYSQELMRDAHDSRYPNDLKESKRRALDVCDRLLARFLHVDARPASDILG